MNPDCVIGFLQIKQDYASVSVKIVAIGNIIRDPGKLRYGGVFFMESELCGRRCCWLTWVVID
jgi:hypothetical protein